MIKYLSAESEYLIKLIKSAVKGENPPDAESEIDWAELFGISKSQQVYSIISSVVFNQKGLPEDISDELKRYTNSELLRMLAMKNELELLEDEFKEHKIRFMLLKGSVLKELYPMQRMRQMSDIDILYDFRKRDELIKIMRSHGYRMTAACENSDDFFKKPYFTFELHRELFFEEAEFCPHFDLWKNAVQDSENPYKYHINGTDHFVYTICHMYKHYITAGCGVRFLCDIYLMMKKDGSIDFKLAEKQLEDIGILHFANDVTALALAVFDNGDVTERQQRIFDYMLSNGVYGIKRVDYKKALEDCGNSKLKYIFKRLFPSFEKMRADYKQLEKRPYLLLYFYIKRLVYKIRYNSSSARKELKEINSIK